MTHARIARRKLPVSARYSSTVGRTIWFKKTDGDIRRHTFSRDRLSGRRAAPGTPWITPQHSPNVGGASQGRHPTYRADADAAVTTGGDGGAFAACAAQTPLSGWAV